MSPKGWGDKKYFVHTFKLSITDSFLRRDHAEQTFYITLNYVYYKNMGYI